MVEKYFGSIPKGPSVKKQRVEPVILANDKYASYDDNISLPMTLMVFPTVPNWHRDEAPIDVLADILGSGNNSIFYKNFVKTEDAIQVGVSHPASELAGEFQITVFAYPDKTFEEVEEMIRLTFEDFEEEGVTEDQVQRSKAKIESGSINRFASVAGKAQAISSWNRFLSKPYNVSDEMERYRAVTKEDVMRVYNKYIKGRHAAIINVHPMDPTSTDSVKSYNPFANIEAQVDPQYDGLTYEKPTDNFDRSIQPKAGPTLKAVIPDYFQVSFDNGIKFIGTQTTEVPKVYISMTMAGGNLVLEDRKLMGLCEMTAALMNEGTESSTPEEMSAKLDALGSIINFSGGSQSTSIYIECMTENLEATLKLLEEKLMHPAFSAEDFKRVQKQYKAALKNRLNSAQALGSEAFGKLVYGETVLANYPNEKSIKGLKLDDVQAYYDKYYTPATTSVVIAGEVTQAEVMGNLDFLKNWKSKSIKLPADPEIMMIEETTVYVVHKPRSPHSPAPGPPASLGSARRRAAPAGQSGCALVCERRVRPAE